MCSRRDRARVGSVAAQDRLGHIARVIDAIGRRAYQLRSIDAENGSCAGGVQTRPIRPYVRLASDNGGRRRQGDYVI